MSIQFWQLLVDNVPAIIVSITGFVALFVRQATKEQVNKTTKEITNSHPVHIRDDMDDKHSEMVEMFQELKEGISDQFNKVDKKLDHLENREEILLERIGNVEHNANTEHSNIWKAVAGLRRNKNV